MICPCCDRREPRAPQVCDADRWRQRRWLVEVRGLVAMLSDPQTVVDERLAAVMRWVDVDVVDGLGQPVLYPDGRLVRRRERRPLLNEHGEQVWALADPVAGGLPAAAVAGESHQPQVSGTPEASTPASLSAVDLTLDYHHRDRRITDTMVPKVRTWADPDRYVLVMVDGRPVRQQVWHREVVVDEHGAPVMVPAGDQIGELSVTALLDSWAQVWLERRRGRGERGPRRSVEALTRWLYDRVDDACDDGYAIADWHAELGHLVAILRAVNGLTEHDEYLDGVACPHCDRRSLWRTNGSEWIECANCPHLMSADEYRRHTQWLVSVRHRSEGQSERKAS
jgi:Zn ribbon nucleic-acid-binding protein